MGERKEVKPVIQGTVKKRERNELQKFGGGLLSGDLYSAGQYVLNDVLIPALKDMAFRSFTNGLNMMLYGEARDERRSNNGGRTPYQTYYKGNNNNYSSRPQSAIRPSGIADYEDLIFETRGDAELVVDGINDLIEEYGRASVNDFYDLAGTYSSNVNSTKYGWTTYQRAHFDRTSDGAYTIRLDRPVAL